jgi:hypothetical protein
MATDQSQLGYTTLTDVISSYSSSDARAQFVKPAKVLTRTCPLLEFLPFVPANNMLFNVARRTDYLDTPSTRRFNEAALVTSSKNTNITDDIAMWESWSVEDSAFADIQPDPTAYMSDQIDNKVEGFRQKLESSLFYGSPATDVGGIRGLATRINNLESLPNGDGQWPANAYSGGVTSGNSTSIWVLELGRDKVQAIYPVGTPGGLEINTLGKMPWTMATGLSGVLGQSRALMAYVTQVKWSLGIQIVDERCAQRIANTNPTPLQAGGFDENILIQALGNLPAAGNAPGTVILCNRAVLNEMNIRAVSQKTNGYYTQNMETGDIWGSRRITRFQGIQVVMAEKIVNTETVIS